jgi:glycosyltransferase involved in cell wall biosynthesis
MNTLICIPVFNKAKYIQRSIDSCLKQTIKVEIWIFDNCSSDNSYNIANSYLLKYKNIKLFKNEKNIGRTGNWNRCLDEFMKSSFKYIKFIFPGDEIYPDCIEKVEKVFSKYKNLGAVYFPYKFIATNGKSSILKDYDKDKFFNSREITKIQLSEGSKLGAIVCNVYSRYAIKNHRFNLNLISKGDFDIKVLEYKSLYYINECLAIFLKEAHSTFDSVINPFGYFEFSYSTTKELERIKKKKRFTKKEIFEIEQRQIIKSVKDQLSFISIFTSLKIIIAILTNIIKKINN